MTIDEGHDLKLKQLKGKKTKSDHNTILLRLSLEKPKKTLSQPTYKWRINDNTDWQGYNETSNQLFDPGKEHSYRQWADLVLKTAHRTIGSRKVGRKPKTSQQLKAARTRKQLSKRILNDTRQRMRNHNLQHLQPPTPTLNTSTQANDDKLEEAKKEYEGAKTEVERVVIEEESNKAEKLFRKIVDTGGVHSKAFWGLKRSALRNGEDMSCLKKDDGSREYDPDNIKTMVAEYYEDLYRNDPDKFDNPAHTEIIEQAVSDFNSNRSFENRPFNVAFTLGELLEVIKSLPDGKAAGPNRVCYELVKYGGLNLQVSLLNVFNKVADDEICPQEWQHAVIAMLPKGRKDPERLENKRGISLADTACKIFERLILRRIENVLDFSDAQAGARKGRSTTDQVFVLKTTIRSRRAQGKTTYLAFLDLHKAYDRIWKAAVLYNLWEQGVRGKMWRLMKQLNTGLTAEVKTRFGLTRVVEIAESLRQGGVLSGPEFASLIDRCETSLKLEGLGVPLGEDLIASILLMDDITLVAESAEQLRQMLDQIDLFASEWHLTFSQDKSKIMIIYPPGIRRPREDTEHQWKIGPLAIARTDTYTYLGEVITSSCTMEAHIKHITGKMHTQSRRIKSVGAEQTLSNIKMASYLELHDKCLIPSLLYNCETWILTEKEKNQINDLQIKALRALLRTPPAVPKLAYQAELGIQPLMASVHARQLGYLWKLLDQNTCVCDHHNQDDRTNCTGSGSRAARALATEVQENSRYSWFSYMRAVLNQHRLPTDMKEIHRMPKATWKTRVKKAIAESVTKEYTIHASNSIKMIRGINLAKDTPSLEKYMTELTRRHATAIFRLRSRSTRAGADMTSLTSSPVCTKCGNGYESDVHLFTACTATQELRNRWGVTDLGGLYLNTTSMSVLRNYAEFAIEVGIVPEW
jgi:hypothetical protein